MSKEQTPRKQCAKCPWKVSTDPYEIPDGYDVKKHRDLEGTIANPGDPTARHRPTANRAAQEPRTARIHAENSSRQNSGPDFGNRFVRLLASRCKNPGLSRVGAKQNRFGRSV